MLIKNSPHRICGGGEKLFAECGKARFGGVNVLLSPLRPVTMGSPDVTPR